jgi:excisionase family DNA binding protein
MNERWLSVEEIAAHLDVNPDSIHEWITRRKMPGYKLGGLGKFLAIEFDHWVKPVARLSDSTGNEPAMRIYP